MSLYDLHQRSTSLASQELAALGFKLRSGDVERVLYPHSLTHPVGIGASHSLPSQHISLLLIWLPSDLHESEKERSPMSVHFMVRAHAIDALDTG